jgi:hypothetical protein
MVVRGVFKETTKARGGRGPAPLDEAAKLAVRDAWDRFMKPHLRA